VFSAPSAPLLLHRLLLGGLLLGALAGRAATPPPYGTLDNAADVLRLTAQDAGQRIKVSVTGVVTAAESDWNGQFFMQDATGGVFVENLTNPQPAVGDLIELEGVTHPGAFAPIISAPKWRKLGTAPLPEAKQVAIEDLMAGTDDSQRIEVVGTVRTATPMQEKNRVLIELAVAGYRLQVEAHIAEALRPESLVAARVRVRATAAAHYIATLRHLTSVALYAPREEDFTVLATEQMNPFAEPVIPINAVAQYRHGHRAEQRVHIRGAVTLQRPGVDLFLQDNSGGIRVESAQRGSFALGDQVEAAGFLEYENHLPLLRDATFRRAAGPNHPVAPRHVPFEEITRGEHHGDFITLRGRILDRSKRPYTLPDGTTLGEVTTWLVQSPEITFTVEHVGRADNPAFAAIPIGSVVDFDGVCVCTIEIVTNGTSGKLTSLRLLLPSPDHLHLIERPSWFTPQRLLIGLAILTAVLFLVVGWLLTMAKKNAALRGVVRQLEEAQRELQEAHDTLEQKVIERSAQLQVEMTARKSAELQFKGVLAERTRLARDLHDTLEQTLTGIALRLNTAAKLSRRDPDASTAHLQFARNCLHQSQVDLRRSIWDLRSRELEQFDLASALRYSAEQLADGKLADGSDIEVDFQTKGTPQRLSEIVEENVLRIAQEALTNIAKHARASHVKVLLEFDSAVFRLRIEDNGQGFDRERGPADGHFGLIGMGERAKRLAGRVFIDSSVGRGTTIVVEVPLTPNGSAEPQPPPSPENSVQ
jgi:signal transduction histidine kinase